MAFELPALPYSHSALAANGMCQETLELHHGKHHNAYVTALNGFVTANAALQGKSLDEIVKISHADASMAGVFNNAGQHWNHIVFWNNMSPTGGGIPGKTEVISVRIFQLVESLRYGEAHRLAAGVAVFAFAALLALLLLDRRVDEAVK